MASPEELQAAEADAERRRQEELYAVLTQPSFVATEGPSVGTSGDTDPHPFNPNQLMFGWADTPFSYWQQQGVSPGVLSDDNILQYGRAYQYLRENPETVYDPNSEFRRQLEIAADLVNRFNVALPNKSTSFGEGLISSAGGMLRTLATNPAVMGALTGYLATPAVAGAAPIMTPMQAGITTGAVSGAASNENPLVGAIKGGAIGGATVGAADYAGNFAKGMFPESPWVAGLARGGAGALTQATLSGSENPFLAGAQGALMGGLSVYGQPAPQPEWYESLSDQEFDAMMAEVDAALAPQPMSTGMIPLASPESTQQFLSTVPEAVPGTTLPIGGQEIDITSPDALQAAIASGNLIAPKTDSVSALDAAPEAAAPETPAESAINKEGLTKFAKKAIDILSQMLGDRAAPEFVIPEQEEGQSDEDYLAEISDLALDYLGLDADAMKDAGFEPGTQEYLDYILATADKVIAAAFKGASVDEMEGKSVEELQAAFKGKSEEEMQSLLRALHVRGALGSKSYSESQIDPFTGNLEYLGAEGATGPTAGAQRGYARFLEETAGLSAPEARRAIKGLLGRDVDIFGLGEAKKERTLQDMLAEFNAMQPVDDEEDDLFERRGGTRRATRGRGMLPAASNFWQQFRK